MSRPPTLDYLRRKAASTAKAAEAAEQKAAVARAWAEVWRKAVEERERLHSTTQLHAATIRATDKRMQTDAAAKVRRGPPIRGKGPAADAARFLGVSLQDLALAIDVPYATVRSWAARGAVPSGPVREKLLRPPYAPKP